MVHSYKPDTYPVTHPKTPGCMYNMGGRSPARAARVGGLPRMKQRSAAFAHMSHVEGAELASCSTVPLFALPTRYMDGEAQSGRWKEADHLAEKPRATDRASFNPIRWQTILPS
jgi:hypothetical protein